MKSRLLPQRRAGAAPRMTVRNHVPWWFRIGVAVAALLVAAAAGFMIARHGMPASTSVDTARLIEDNRLLRAEHDLLTESTNTTDSRRAMEGSTIRELGEQVARLEAANARLKEDVAFFEAATADRQPATAGNAGIAIRRFQVMRDAAGSTARYRILLTQDAKANRDFTGEMQLVLTVVEKGKAVNIVLPESPADAARYAVSFRSYKRIDGVFEIPADAVLKSVQVRILDHGAVRVQQSVNLG